jgi:hypothetical protein
MVTDLSRSDNQRFKKCCILDEMDERMRKKLGKLAVHVRT